MSLNRKVVAKPVTRLLQRQQQGRASKQISQEHAASGERCQYHFQPHGHVDLQCIRAKGHPGVHHCSGVRK